MKIQLTNHAHGIRFEITPETPEDAAELQKVHDRVQRTCRITSAQHQYMDPTFRFYINEITSD